MTETLTAGRPSASESPEVWAGRSREEAIPRLFEIHGSRVYAIGLKLCRDAADAEDLVQEVFLRAWQSWDRFRGESSPTTWLWTIATRVCSRRHRIRAGEPRRFESLSEPTAAGEPSGTDPEADDRERESRDLVERGLPLVPEPFRVPLLLKEIAGFSLEEIGRILDVPVGTVKTRVHRGRIQLRDILVDLGMPGPSPPEHPQRRLCVELLEAKQEALDRGVEFPLPPGELCERCRDVFRHLDEVRDICGLLTRDEPAPAGVLDRIRALAADGA